MPTKPRPTKPRRNRLALERLVELEQVLASCKSHRRIELELSAKWGVSRRTIRRYVSLVYARWRREAEVTAPHRRDELRAAFRGLYGRALDRDELRAAVAVLDRLARLDGCYAPDRVEVNSAAPTPILDGDRIRERIAELLAKHPHLAPPAPKGTP